MDPTQKYLRVETAIAAAIGGALSLVFALVLFGGRGAIALSGAHGLILDAIPQSFLLALPCALISAMLVRGRLKRGKVAPFGGERSRRPSLHPVARSLLLAVLATGAGYGAQAVLLPKLTAAAWPFMTVLAFKALYGALVAALVAWVSVRAELNRESVIPAAAGPDQP